VTGQFENPKRKVLMNIAASFPSVKKPRLCQSGEERGTQKQQKTGNWHCGDLLIG
jgi:hypothetical protein